MQGQSLKTKAANIILLLSAFVIVVLPFHAFLTVWGASLIGHYTLLRLWKEVLLLFAALGVIWLLFTDRKVRGTIFKNRISWAIAAYAGLDLIVAAWGYSSHHVSGKAVAYGLLDDLRFLMMLIIVWAAALRSGRLNKKWAQLILWPAVIVILFGLLQLSILPTGFLSHFGYGASTIPLFETINHNPHYVRIISTLRGSDPLGAYLILPISALVVLLLKGKKSWSWARTLLLFGAIIVLYGSFSRGAWIGAVLALVVICLTQVNSETLLLYRPWLVTCCIILLALIVVSGVALSKSPRFQNIIFHTQTHSSSRESSDQQHLSAVKSGLQQVFRHPFGEGPGASGPASVYNRYGGGNIPEDYFLEIGEESGWLGAILFIFINIIIAYELWLRRRDSFALTLLAAFIAITFVNLLTLAWTDDTISYIWWGLAGLCLASVPIEQKVKESPNAAH